MTQLPTPSFDAIEHSKQLVDLIKSEIARNSGWLSFYEYMQLALYADNLGYYTAGLQRSLKATFSN